MVVTHTGYRAGGELAERCFHGNNARGEDLIDRDTRNNTEVKAELE